MRAFRLARKLRKGSVVCRLVLAALGLAILGTSHARGASSSGERRGPPHTGMYTGIPTFVRGMSIRDCFQVLMENLPEAYRFPGSRMIRIDSESPFFAGVTVEGKERARQAMTAVEHYYVRRGSIQAELAHGVIFSRFDELYEHSINIFGYHTAVDHAAFAGEPEKGIDGLTNHARITFGKFPMAGDLAGSEFEPGGQIRGVDPTGAELSRVLNIDVKDPDRLAFFNRVFGKFMQAERKLGREGQVDLYVSVHTEELHPYWRDVWGFEDVRQADLAYPDKGGQPQKAWIMKASSATLRKRLRQNREEMFRERLEARRDFLQNRSMEAYLQALSWRKEQIYRHPPTAADPLGNPLNPAFYQHEEFPLERGAKASISLVPEPREHEGIPFLAQLGGFATVTGRDGVSRRIKASHVSATSAPMQQLYDEYTGMMQVLQIRIKAEFDDPALRRYERIIYLPVISGEISASRYRSGPAAVHFHPDAIDADPYGQNTGDALARTVGSYRDEDGLAGDDSRLGTREMLSLPIREYVAFRELVGFSAVDWWHFGERFPPRLRVNGQEIASDRLPGVNPSVLYPMGHPVRSLPESLKLHLPDDENSPEDRGDAMMAALQSLVDPQFNVSKFLHSIGVQRVLPSKTKGWE